MPLAKDRDIPGIVTYPLLIVAAVSAVLLFANALGADDYMCVDPKGCEAVLSNESGVRTVRFRKGDVVQTGAGWVVDPAKGWKRVDIWEVAGLLACPN